MRCYRGEGIRLVGAASFVSQQERDDYTAYTQLMANEKLNPPLNTLADLYDMEVDPLFLLQGPVPAQDISQGWVDVTTGQ